MKFTTSAILGLLAPKAATAAIDLGPYLVDEFSASSSSSAKEDLPVVDIVSNTFSRQDPNAKLLRLGAKLATTDSTASITTTDSTAVDPSDPAPEGEEEPIPSPEMFDDAWRTASKSDGEMPPPYEEEVFLAPTPDVDKIFTENDGEIFESTDEDEMLGTSSACGARYRHWLGDGYCDKNGAYNTFECGWDGGDCCENTCVNKDYTCGHNGYDCKGNTGDQWYAIHLDCGHDSVSGEDSNSNVKWSWKRSDGTWGTSNWLGNRQVCKKSLQNLWQYQDGLFFEESQTITSFKIELSGNDALFIDSIWLSRKTPICSWCPGTAGEFFHEETMMEQGANGGKGWCLGTGSTPSGWSNHCGGGKLFRCIEWRNNGYAYSC